jgi:dihydroceramide fatty acyl 2-hydroxylase
MFDTPLLERLSVVHPACPTLVYLPAGAFLFWRSVTGGVGFAPSVGLYASGLLVWSLVEYLAHRGSFHHEPHTKSQLAFAYLVHGVHHAYPDDSRRWMMPLTVTIPVAALLFVAFRFVFGGPGDRHYFIHRGRMPGRIGRFLRQYHMAHHYTKADRHYGVSSPLWDIVFRTR